LRRKTVGLTIFQVDAFTDRIFSGNPAAVCILPEARDETWMQNVAREMNLSETAFLHREGEGYRLRWFTPVVEVDLCGHATLASAHTLYETGSLGKDEEVRFYTRSGVLTAKHSRGWIELNFPSEQAKDSTAPAELLRSLGIKPRYVGKNRFDYIVEVESEDIVRRMKPDYSLLAHVTTRGIIVTSRSDSDKYDFVSRFFAPAVGINEDPVTGSAHCCLGPFWKKRLHKDEFTAYQASERGGVVKVRLEGDRVFLLGQAVTVLKGELCVFP
jgi:PhzF family phenazine biosynthesis protein